MPNLNNLTTQDKQWGAGLWSSKGYIDGLTMQWVSGTALTVTTGTAYIESEQRLIPVTSAIAKTGLSLSASTWYHVYLYLNAGTPDIEIVTTAPASPYHGTARSKTGDTSRRYLGSIRSSGSSSILAFKHSPEAGTIVYNENVDAAPLVVLSGGAATVATTISCSDAVPVTSMSAVLLANNNATGQIVYMSNSSAVNPLSTAHWKAFVNAAGSFYADFQLDGSQAFNYLYSAAPTGGQFFARVAGYTYER